MNKKSIWSIIGLVTMASMWFVYHYFEKALPFVHVSISMTASQAEQEARLIANEQKWNLQDYNTAVLFEDDGPLQAFIELEGGGKQAFIDMIDRGYYHPYLWRIRFFKEKEIGETSVWFTPSGQRNAFKQKLSEDQPGNNILESEALKIAQQAAKDWGYDLTRYYLVEHNEKNQPSKRLDHVFTYEFLDASLNKGLYRLQIVISGDQVTKVFPFIKIPDEFNRRYAQMSSANSLIASLAKGTAILLYFFVFGLFGLFILYRKKYVSIKNALKIIIISFVLGLVTWINWLPLVWNYYATTTSKYVFLMQVLGSMLISVGMISIFLGVFFVIAESFDRYVFGKHIQIFKLWIRDVANSSIIFEQTVLGYCMAINSIAYLTAFYMLASSWGWWYPLQTNFDPNILSTYIPFLSPCIRALGAGFGEELIFRIVPIAGILLLTRKSKQQRYWLLGILIVQSLIFGAAHAFYPQQPAYFRIVELFVEFFLYGICYCIGGILPCIIAHFTYDALLMSTPIFVSNMLLQKVFALFCIGIPLWIVIVRWIQNGCRWSVVPSSAYNESIQVPFINAEEVEIQREQGQFIFDSIKKHAYIFGAIGLLLFISFKEFKFDTPSICVSQKEVKEIAQKALTNQYGDIGSGWNVLLAFFTAQNDNGNTFIFREYGRSLYQALQDSYVIPPHYVVRYVKFDGSVEQRAEEYAVMVSAQGKIIKTLHTLPESQQGADISEDKAKDLAYDFVDKMYNLKPNDLDIVSCESTKHEARRDWIVIFSDIKNYQQALGQAYVEVFICGDEIAGYLRHVNAPEAWKRAEQERLTKVALFKLVCSCIYVLLIFFFILLSSIRLGAYSRLLRFGGMIAGATMLIEMLSMINNWKIMQFGLHSAQPVSHQIQRWLMMHITSGIGQSIFLAMLLIFALWSTKKGIASQLKSLVLPASALAFGLVGLFSALAVILPKMQVQMPAYDFVNNRCSLFAMLIHILSKTILTFLSIVIAWTLASRYTRLAAKLGLFIIMGICFVSLNANSNIIWATILLGALWGCLWYTLYYYVYAKNIEILFITLAIVQCVGLIPSVWVHAYPAIIIDAILCFCILMATVIFCCKKLQSVE